MMQRMPREMEVHTLHPSEVGLHLAQGLARWRGLEGVLRIPRLSAR